MYLVVAGVNCFELWFHYLSCKLLCCVVLLVEFVEFRYVYLFLSFLSCLSCSSGRSVGIVFAK